MLVDSHALIHPQLLAQVGSGREDLVEEVSELTPRTVCVKGGQGLAPAPALALLLLLLALALLTFALTKAVRGIVELSPSSSSSSSSTSSRVATARVAEATYLLIHEYTWYGMARSTSMS